MSTIGQLIDRIHFLLQDEDEVAWSRDRVRRALLAESAQLARREYFSQITWLQGQAHQGFYTADDPPPGVGLSPRTVRVADVLYDGRCLREVSEANFALQERRWEANQDVPYYWTTDLQGLTAIRIIPEPVETGSDIPVFPATPLAMPIEKNMVVFAFESMTEEDSGDDQEVEAPEAFEEALVLSTVGSLCSDLSDFADPIKAASYTQLAELMVNLMESVYGD